MKKIFALSLALILCLGLLVGCAKDAGSGEKATAKLILVDKDEKQYTYDLEITDGMTLREALWKNKLISEEEYGAMFVQNIDGHVANVQEDGCTWMPQDTSRKQIMGTFDEITLKSGETIYLQYYVVPDFD